MANLVLKTVSKIYPSGALALYKVNLELNDSEFVAVVGGEKSGKSTLLRVVAGLEESTEGEIIVGGKDVTKEPARDRDIAMIFQGNSLYPALNVFENMAYGLRLRKVSNSVIEQRVKAAAEILGLTEILYRKPKALTGEQKQLVAFGRAIVREPKLYLLDDPISGVAPEVRERLRSVLVNLQVRMKGTFVYASKNVNEALTMATRMIVLRDGFVQQIDTPSNLYEYPANAFVAFTVGAPTVNFINGATVEKEGDNLFIVSGATRIALPENIVKRFTSADEYAGTGKKIIAGIRPEDITVADEGFFTGKIGACEEIGGVQWADCEGDKLSFVARGNGCQKGDAVTLAADMTHCFLFDAETRLTLLERDEGYQKTDFADAAFTPLAYEEEERLKKKFNVAKVQGGKNKNAKKK